jgi:YVTN family beta-propeller protein
LGRFVYVANLVSNAVDNATISMYTINSRTGVLTPTTPATVPTGFFPQGIGIDPSGKFVYTANSDDNTVSAHTISSSSGNLSHIGTIATGAQPWRVSADPSGKFVYVANESGSVSIFALNSAGTLSSAGTVETPSGAFAITVVQARQ